MMRTNELKKGDRVQLRNGWYATIADNAKGNTRTANVEGFVTEIGNVYSHDIVRIVHLRVDGDDNPLVPDDTRIEHTPAQLKLRVMLERLGL